MKPTTFNELIELINLSNTIELIGNLCKKSLVTSVNFNEIYHDEFNFKRYLICCLNLFIMIIGLILMFLIIYFDSLYNLIDNKYLPKHTKIILFASLVLIFNSIICRLDIIIDEWKNHLSFFKFFRPLHENNKSKHGLIRKNYKKLSLMSNFANLMLIRGSIPTVASLLTLVVIYIAIKSNKLPFYLFTLLFIYLAFMVASTFMLVSSMAVITLYYFTLLFDQINNKIKGIYLRSNFSVTIKDQVNLLRLIREHDLRAQDVKRLNQIVSLTCLVFFIILALMQIIPLNLFLQTDVWYQQIIYLIYLITSLGFCFGAFFIYSMQIITAHKPYKTTYKMLRKQKLNLYFKWKVLIVLIFFFCKNKIKSF